VFLGADAAQMRPRTGRGRRQARSVDGATCAESACWATLLGKKSTPGNARHNASFCHGIGLPIATAPHRRSVIEQRNSAPLIQAMAAEFWSVPQ
jgi:hypothetical protein